MESNDSPEIPDRGETSDIPGLPSGAWHSGCAINVALTAMMYTILEEEARMYTLQAMNQKPKRWTFCRQKSLAVTNEGTMPLSKCTDRVKPRD